MSDLPPPWEPVDDPLQQSRLAAELAPNHVLAGQQVRAIARRNDQDDVLLALEGGGCAVVHLTWTGRRETSAQWPSTQTFTSLEDWKARGREDD